VGAFASVAGLDIVGETVSLDDKKCKTGVLVRWFLS
jgi:hypothetical protein